MPSYAESRQLVASMSPLPHAEGKRAKEPLFLPDPESEGELGKHAS